ncbi:uncharacterized protein LOC126995012 [Eriocheir sinensis]|uniref:uncharacterized protein LOC126995012 n=1 Tax=Eriocheir sinensis TaxID=95602 RepID=UPI0021C8669B|nr:uncharacterized protein LOC126995012 [Eriocheir sinensis]XP_050710275.1 uncharacterized protein LOC126995012 [Eriocheir sinensis]XP_050710276.1 uncharacterized protein LOC126995012 [Eriocheir sinensis]XP_050710277.1 uncharacterized protein LOC126995012 [Eriocheir sinensis]XP_050710278.1 uncharacterized protein LOC126995012 [Eriocheir sinensis]XP_050710279.1 uncharacterized protein LOC126995012 [Eriocheir sinensis]
MSGRNALVHRSTFQNANQVVELTTRSIPKAHHHHHHHHHHQRGHQHHSPPPLRPDHTTTNTRVLYEGFSVMSSSPSPSICSGTILVTIFCILSSSTYSSFLLPVSPCFYVSSRKLFHVLTLLCEKLYFFQSLKQAPLLSFPPCPLSPCVSDAKKRSSLSTSSNRGLRGAVVSTLGSRPREPGFDSRADWKNLGGFSDTLRPCPPSSEWVLLPGINRGLCPPVSWGLFPSPIIPSPSVSPWHMTTDVAPNKQNFPTLSSSNLFTNLYSVIKSPLSLLCSSVVKSISLNLSSYVIFESSGTILLQFSVLSPTS